MSEEERAASLERGNAAAAALMANLSAQLKAALASGGPEQAIVVCQQVAHPITEAAAGQFEGLEISRTSLKTRNRANAPTERDREVLEEWQSLHGAGRKLPPHTLERVAPDRVVFYKPIMVQELCLQCHGDRESMDAGLRERLAELYPDDQAHGYEEGDLRGTFRVEMSPER